MTPVWLYGLAWLVGSALMVALIITALRLLGWWRE